MNDSPMLRILPTLFFLFLLTTLPAQKKYLPGFIVTLDQDTVSGRVKDRSSGTINELYSKIRFKKPKGGLRKKYSPDQISGYGIRNQYFESVALQEEMNFFRASYLVHPGAPKVFLKVVQKNDVLSYYHMEFMDGDNGYIDFFPLFHKPDSPEMVRVTQGIFGLKRKRLAEYFSECAELSRALEEKQLNDAIEVFEFYRQNCPR